MKTLTSFLRLLTQIKQVVRWNRNAAQLRQACIQIAAAEKLRIEHNLGDVLMQRDNSAAHAEWYLG